MNFNREKSKKSMETPSNEETNYGNKPSFDESLDTRKSSTSDSLPLKARVTTKKDESIFWASPPPASTSQSVANSNQSTGQMTTTITKATEDDLSSNQSSGSDRKLSDKSETDLKKDSKSLEELQFLPRSLHQTDV